MTNTFAVGGASIEQERLCALEEMYPSNPALIRVMAIRVDGPLDTEFLRASITEIGRRHSALRLTFPPVDGHRASTLRPVAVIPFEVTELGPQGEKERASEVERQIGEETSRPFDLAEGPLVRTRLLVFEGDDAPVLLVFAHAAVFDEHSSGIFLRELASIYDSIAASKPPSLRDSSRSVDSGQWQRQSPQSSGSLVAFWREQLSGELPTLALATDYPRPASRSLRATSASRALPPALVQALELFSRREGVPLATTLLAAFSAMLYRYTGQDDILIGMPTSGRMSPDSYEMIGAYGYPIVIRSRVSPDMSVRALLRRVYAVAAGAEAHRGLPFGAVLAEIRAPSEPSRHPLFQAAFEVQEPPADVRTVQGVTLRPLLIKRAWTEVDLRLTVTAGRDEIITTLTCSADLFDDDTVARILDHYRTLLSSMVGDAEQSIGLAPMLTEAERRRLLVEWNNTRSARPVEGSITALFEAQVDKNPDAIAVAFQEQRLSYRELDKRSNQLANYLVSAGVGPDVLVGICVERSVEMVIGLLGVLKAGGAFLPLDPTYPKDRLAFMVQDSGVAVLLTFERLLPKIAAYPRTVICMDSTAKRLALQSEERPSVQVSASSLAYVIYTSGSTGRPKGVLVEHRGVCNWSEMQARTLELGPGTRLLQFARLSFDASVWEVFTALTSGSTLWVAPQEALLPGPALDQLLREHAINITLLPPSALAVLSPEDLPALRTLIVGGEACSAELVARWAPGRSFWNFYGPTEITVYATSFLCAPDGRRPAIGRPIANTQVYVLDPRMQPVPIGVPGELYIGGAGLARGYLKRPELSAERFVQSPFSGDPSKRVYKTGDQVRWLKDGTLEFLGRLDHQVKVRGFRIELEEIDAVLRQHPNVRESIVIVREDAPGDQRIVAYLVPRDGRPPAAADLKAFLSEKLPSFMVPSAFVALQSMPLTPSDKIDRRALPAPAREATALRRVRIQPRDVEQALVKHPEVRAAVVTQDSDAAGQRLIAYWARRGQRRLSASELRRFLRQDLPDEALPAEIISVTFEQERMFDVAQAAPGSGVAQGLAIIRISGPLDVKILRNSLDDLVLRHPALRTGLRIEQGQLTRSVEPPAPLGVDVLDLALLPEFDWEEEIARQAFEELRRESDLASGRPARASMIRFGREVHVLFFSAHLAVFDEGSLEVFMRDLAAVYGAFAAGKPSPLPDPPVAGGGLVAWQRRWLEGARLSRALVYWKERLAGELPPLELPTDRARPPSRSTHGARVSAELPGSLFAGLEALCQREGVSFFVALLAAWSALLSRYSGQGDILIGTPFSAARARPWGQGVIDRIDHPVVVRAELSGDPSFRELARRLATEWSSAQAHGEVPFAMVLEELALAPDPSRHPVFQAGFELGKEHVEAGAPGLTFSASTLERGAIEVDVLLALRPAGEGLNATLFYNADLFDTATMERMLEHLQTLLEGAVQRPGEAVSALPLLAASERRRIVVEWNETRTDYPRSACVHELFQAQVERAPDAIAAVFEGAEISYRELNERANRLGRALKGLGVGPDVPVAIFVERSLDMLIGLLAILKAGGAYVPLDPAYPAERLQLMLQTSGAPVLVARRDGWEKVPFAGKRVDFADGDASPSGAENIASGATADSIAYVMFTSGSTGRPKGVAVPHRGVVRLVVRTDYVEFSARDRVLNASNLSFDASTFEIWGALLNGACLHVMKQETLLSPQLFEEAVRRDRITVMFLSTALFHQMASVIPGAFSGLEYLVIGGDALDPKWCKETLEKGPPKRLVNGYGPTENTTFSTSYLVRETSEGATSVPIGRPIANSTAYVLDKHLAPVPPGLIGELYVGGDGLARGYINNPELTAERFVKNPFTDAPGRVLYKTGDRARYLPDGVIEFLGRADNQVKIRGFRVELGEIEAALGALSKIREVAVTIREDVPGDKRLVAYASLLGGAAASPAELRAYLQEKLPAYMIPAHFVVLDRLPMTPNGKVDRRVLPPPGRGKDDAEAGVIAPRNQIEDALASIWKELLGLPKIDVNESFLELGGHSILAIQLLSRVFAAYRVNVPFRAFFEAPTVAELAALVDSAVTKGETTSRLPRIPRVSRDKPLVLSFSQQQLWLLSQVDPLVPFYNESVTVRIPGPLSAELLEKSILEMIRRHEILRTTFGGTKGQPVQIVHPTANFKLGNVDLTGAKPEEREALALSVGEKDAREPFNLSEGPFFRATLVKVDEGDHRLFVTMHHIITDGVSFHTVLLKELSAIYAAFEEGKPSPLPEPPLQFADYAFWHRKTFVVEMLEPHIQYWDKKLADLSVLALPTDRPRPAFQKFRGAKRSFVIEKDLFEAVKALSRKEGATLYMTLLAAFKAMLSRYANQADIVVGSPVSTRSRTELESLFGFFVNLIVLRTDLSGDPTFREVIRRVREVTLDAYAHQDVPFEMLVEELRVPRTRSHNPIFQVVFVLEPPLSTVDLGWTLSQHDVDTGTSKFDLTLTVDERPDRALARFEYDAALFDGPTIDRMIGHFLNVLRSVTATPDIRVSDVPLMGEAERREILGWNNDRGSFPKDLPLQDLFAVQAYETPTAIAVIYESSRLTYRELDCKANMLANYLSGLGVGTEVRVALLVGRSLEMVVAILAVLKAGGAYVPIDPEEPTPRIQTILQDAKPTVILTQSGLMDRIGSSGIRTLCLDTEWSTIAEEPDAAPVTDVGPDNLAYVMYTGGATGRPRGVMVTHHNVVRLFKATWDTFEFTSRDVWTLFHSYAFDFSVWEMWGALLYGGRLVVVPQSVTKSPEAFYGLIGMHKVSVLNLIPSAFLHLMQVDESSDEPAPLSSMTLRLICLGGESFDISMLRAWIDRHGDRYPRLFNLYGLTGATIFATHRQVTLSDVFQVTGNRIGRPLPDTEIYILDSRLRPVPTGVAGEMYIGGDGLARGYLGRPALTAERYIRHPFRSDPSARLHKTGDLARYTIDGDIEFVGRVDEQFKVRGFRIEPTEIEAALIEHPDVREAVVLVREDTAGDQRLVAYYVKRSDRVPTTNELRSFLKEKLPDYQVPTVFVVIPAVPRQSSGKINRKSLPAPDRNRPSLAPIFRLPTNPVEILLLGIWTRLLQVNQIGIKDDFFSLGGHSLLAAQMIARVRETFRIDIRHSSFLLRQFLENPTISGLADAVEMVRDATPSVRGRRGAIVKFAAEAALDASLGFDAPRVADAANPSAVFLTGATGFLGAFLLSEILEQTKADVYCLVRAYDTDSGLEKLRQNLEQNMTWDPRYSSRIIPVLGDLSQLLVGLSPDQFLELTRKIDVIYHNGALVNFIYPYAALRAANVGGTREIIRLATQTRMKPVHYISTLAVLSSYGFFGVRRAREDIPLQYAEHLFMGYPESKWVAEKLLMNASREGLPVTIYRPHDVTGHSVTGAWKTEGFLCSFLKALIELKSAPDINLPLDFAPVDYVTKAIVHIACTKEPTGKVYHLNNPVYALLPSMLQRMREVGYQIETIPYHAWVQRLVDYTAQNPSSSIAPFVPLFVERWSDAQISVLEMYCEERIPVFECDNTLAAVAGTGLVCPPVDDQLLRKYLDYFLRIGFIPPPGAARSS
jgi:amino acid adenylation domain-containing protein/thioester reductase-like protein